MDVAGHDSNLALTWLDDSWTVWSNQASLALRSHYAFDLDHVQGWNSLGNADNQIDLCLDGLQNGVSGEWGWHIDHGSLSSGLRFGIGDGSENGQTQMRAACFATVHSTNDLGAIS